MKKLRRLDVIRRLAFCMFLILPATLGAQTRPPIVEKIARTYGLDSWDRIEAIRYNFNAEGALKDEASPTATPLLSIDSMIRWNSVLRCYF